MSKDTRELYNDTAARWARREPNSLSDFTARPRVFALCGDVSGARILDLGAGEGYCAREMMLRGAASVVGIELSEQMVELARSQQDAGGGIDYRVGDVTALDVPAQSFDLALGVFVYNYLTVEQTRESFKQVYQALKPGGSFVFSVPHPAFPFIKRELTPPFYFDMQEGGYFSGRNRQCQGEIFCRDGTSLSVQMIPKTFADYFDALADAGFAQLPVLEELHVTDEMLEIDAAFFSPLVDLPLHLAFRLVK